MFYQILTYNAKIYHYAVGLTRKLSGSVSMGFLYAIGETMFAFMMMVMIMVFLRGMGMTFVRGEFGLYILTGIGPFLLHNKIIKDVSGVSGETRNMPMLGINRGVLILGNLLHSVYMQIVCMAIFFVGVYIYYGGVTIENPRYAFWIMLVLILWSCSLGMIFLAIMPFWQKAVKRLIMVYTRVGMITSGKMVPGNMLSGKMKGMYEYNPLFHIIDQLRGAVFVNYTPFNSDIMYSVKASIIVIVFAIILYFALKRYQ